MGQVTAFGAVETDGYLKIDRTANGKGIQYMKVADGVSTLITEDEYLEATEEQA